MTAEQLATGKIDTPKIDAVAHSASDVARSLAVF
jgi:hypothetical protein